jgi:hypothetical protein
MVALAPCVGLYGDYYFNTDNAPLGGGLRNSRRDRADGWSARATGDIAAKFGNGAQVTVGAERSGIGNCFTHGSVPF